MAANFNEKTLMAALIPPGPAHVKQSVYSAGLPGGDPRALVKAAAVMTTLVADSYIRSTPKSSIRMGVLDRLPMPDEGPLSAELSLRMLRLSCLTSAYDELWRAAYSSEFLDCQWAADSFGLGLRTIADVDPEWSRNVPLRLAVDRRQAQVEIDALVALLLGLTNSR